MKPEHREIGNHLNLSLVLPGEGERRAGFRYRAKGRWVPKVRILVFLPNSL